MSHFDPSASVSSLASTRTEGTATPDTSTANLVPRVRLCPSLLSPHRPSPTTGSGWQPIHHELSAETPEEELLALIAELNGDARVTGILCQLPLPAHMDEGRVIRDRKSTRLNSSHSGESRMPSSA